ncbi:MAG: DUF2891 domain-containing protein [Planctomycetaceae bacterium]
MTRPSLDFAAAARFARLALDCLGREYPNHPLTLLLDDGDVLPPREHTPAFFGCFDWHSAVHGHWTLVRLLRCLPDAEWSTEARSALRQSLTPENLAAEVRHLSKPGREGFERPYGLAWLLQLAAELREWNEPEATAMLTAITELERLCRDRLTSWLPKLTRPIRSGEHSQTAFAMGLALDWSRVVGDDAFENVLIDAAGRFYGDDVSLPLGFEPSGHDFLSPSLAEADLMRRVLPQDEFSPWLDVALPTLASGGRQPSENTPRISREPTRGADAPRSPLSPVESADRADGKLAHLDGLNLSRAWMLDGIASALGENDARKALLVGLADAHAAAGLAAVTGEHYAGGHWLGTFATYLTTRSRFDR